MLLLDQINKESFQVVFIISTSELQTDRMCPDVLPESRSVPGLCGGRGGRRQQTSVRYLGQHGQCGQQDGVHRADGQDTGLLSLSLSLCLSLSLYAN